MNNAQCNEIILNKNVNHPCPISHCQTRQAPFQPKEFPFFLAENAMMGQGGRRGGGGGQVLAHIKEVAEAAVGDLKEFDLE